MSAPSALICNTSGLLAAADSADPDHAAAAAILAAVSGPLVLSPLVLAELDYLLRARLSADAGCELADDVAVGAYEVAPLMSPPAWRLTASTPTSGSAWPIPTSSSSRTPTARTRS